MGDSDPPEYEKQAVPQSERAALANHILADQDSAETKLSRAQIRASGWTAGATVASAVFTLATIGVGLAQWTVLSHTVEEMRDEQRAWLSATPKIVGPLVTKSGILEMEVAVTVKNIGRLPASGIRGRALLFNTASHIVNKSDLLHVCDLADGALSSDGGDLVFPDQNGTIIFQAADRQVYEENERGVVVTPGQSTAVAGEVPMAFCISYLSGGKAPFRHTARVWLIGGNKMGSVIDDGVAIQPSDLILYQPQSDLNWQNYAD